MYKAIYFGDPGGDVEEERDVIKKLLKYFGLDIEIEATDIPPHDRAFDILFFDWGGLSVGNSMLQHFCRWIIGHAEEHPGNVYVMTSKFTEEAMREELSEMPEKPDNIYMSLKSRKALNILKFIVLESE